MAYLLCTEFFLSCVFLNLQCNWNVKCFFGRWCDTLITQHKLDSSIFSSNHLCVICFPLLFLYLHSQPAIYGTGVFWQIATTNTLVDLWSYLFFVTLADKTVHVIHRTYIPTYGVCVSARDFFSSSLVCSCRFNFCQLTQMFFSSFVKVSINFNTFGLAVCCYFGFGDCHPVSHTH